MTHTYKRMNIKIHKGDQHVAYDVVVQGNIVDVHEIVQGGWLAIQGQKIVARGRGEAPSAHRYIDARDQWIFPGVIDGQVHSGSQLNQEGLGIASHAAAAGGITTMVDMPYDDPEPVASPALLKQKAAQVKRECVVDVALFATINDKYGIEVLPGLIEGGACAFKFSTFEATPGRFPRIAEDRLYEVFKRIAPSGLACGVHNQMQELTHQNVNRMIEEGDTGWDAFARAHTPLIENLATSMIYELGAETGARAHAVHVSTSRGFELYKMYKAQGHAVSIETCVQYLMLNHEEHAQALGAKLKHYPPIRPKEEVELLWTHIANGDCTFVSSDHVSWGLERKSNPNIFKNASGGPGLETLLPALWTGCEERSISPTTVARLLAYNPAKHFLLDDRKGSLDVGKDADFVVLEPGRFVFDASKSLSAVKWSSFDGREFRVRVKETWCRGEQIYDGEAIQVQAGYGNFLRPKTLS